MTGPEPRKGILQIKKHMVPASEDGPPISIALDSNESAYGPSPYALQAANAATACLKRYQENQGRILIPALADRFQLDPDRITIGCGSDDLLARLSRAYLEPGSELLRSANSYLKVPNYAYSNDAVPVSAPDREFTADIEAMLRTVTGRTRIVYLANPDNPSGTYISTDKVRLLHDRLPRHVLLVIDCAYSEYVDIEDQHGLFQLVENFQNVVVTRTFSKVYGLAGARVGWLYGPRDVIKAVESLSLTFPLSTPSLAAALAALDDQRHVLHVVGETIKLRLHLATALGALGFKVYPSQANFVLAKFSDPARPAAKAAAALRRRRIAVRRFTAPAYNDCLRITLGFENEVRAAEIALADYMETGR